MNQYLLKLFLTLLFPAALSAQKEGNIWHFGHNNALDFNSDIPVAINGSQQWTFEGCASICDANGNLIFYTNGGGRDSVLSGGQSGGKIWNSLNGLVYNMGNTEGGGFSAAQSSVFIPKPGVADHYYLFTMEEIEYYIGGAVTDQPLGRGLSWFELDALANGGLGALVDYHAMEYVPSYEGLCAIRKESTEDYWIIITDADSGKLVIYSITSAGVAFAGDYFSSMSEMIKGSPDRKWIAATIDGSSTALIPFNSVTGIPGTPFILSASGYFEFSAASNYLYFIQNDGGGIEIGRYNLYASDIEGSYIPVPFGGSPPVSGQMQLGPDHKIYFVAFYGNETTLNAIDCASSSSPYIQSNLFTYESNGSGNSSGDFFGLPNFDNSIFASTDSICHLTGTPPPDPTITFQITPNPATSHINVIANYITGTRYSLQIFNIISGIVMETSFERETTVDLSGLSTGTYLIRLESQHNNAVQKFIKQ